MLKIPNLTRRQAIAMDRFTQELIALLTRHSKEGESDTPDFILARYMTQCLDAFNHATKLRTVWNEAENDEPENAEPAQNGNAVRNP